MTGLRIPADLRVWIDARKRYRLSHAVVQMARELGMNPKKLGVLANAKQERWKAPLPEFIAGLYLRRFGKTAPEPVMTIEEIARRKQEKKQLRRADRAARTDDSDTNAVGSVITKVESMEEEIENLSPSEFAEFRAWFLERDGTE